MFIGVIIFDAFFMTMILQQTLLFTFVCIASLLAFIFVLFFISQVLKGEKLIFNPTTEVYKPVDEPDSIGRVELFIIALFSIRFIFIFIPVDVVTFTILLEIADIISASLIKQLSTARYWIRVDSTIDLFTRLIYFAIKGYFFVLEIYWFVIVSLVISLFMTLIAQIQWRWNWLRIAGLDALWMVIALQYGSPIAEFIAIFSYIALLSLYILIPLKK